jgi:hypothetical protein
VPQNHVGYGLSVVPQNQWDDEDGASTRRDLAACFDMKQVRIEFPSLASRLVEAQHG